MLKRLALNNSLIPLLLIAGSLWAQSKNPGIMSGATASPVIQPAPQTGATAFQVPSQTPAFFTGEVRVKSRVDKTVITVGEIINYQMEIEFPKGYSVSIPPPGAQLGQFLIRKYDFPEPETKPDRMTRRFNFQITAYVTEELSIPPVPVFIQKDNQIVKVILTEETKINVVPVSSPEDMEIKDVKPPVKVPFEYKPLVIAGAILFGLIAVLIGAIYGLRWLRKPKIVEPLPLPEPEELALKELNELIALNLLEKGDLDRYYTKMSEILRRYLGLRFQIYALEFTTEEILQSLKDKWLDHYAYQMVKEFLEECDLVKFARYEPEPKARYEILPKAKRIIELTRPAKPVEEKQAIQGAG